MTTEEIDNHSAIASAEYEEAWAIARNEGRPTRERRNAAGDAMTNQRGRPSNAELTKRVTIMVKPAEHKDITKQAVKSGMTVSAYGRKKLGYNDILESTLGTAEGQEETK